MKIRQLYEPANRDLSDTFIKREHMSNYLQLAFFSENNVISIIDTN